MPANSKLAGSTPLKMALMAAAGQGGEILPEAVDFDGTNDYLSRASDFTGNADGKTFTFSAWVYPDATGAIQIVQAFGTTAGFDIYIQAGNVTTAMQFSARNSAGTIILNATIANQFPIETFSHLLISIDLTNTSNRYVYINDINETSNVTWTTYSNDTIDFTKSVWTVAANNAGSFPFDGRLAHAFLDYSYRDLSVEANRRLFIDADGFPASGQADLSPILYLPMTDPDTVEVNEGTGGDFTLNGTIARSGRGPNQYNAAASTFDGSNDYLSKTSVSFGSDGKTVTFSGIVKIDTQTNNIIAVALADGTATRVQPIRLAWDGSNYKLTIIWKLTSGSNSFQFTGSDVLALGRYYQIDFSVDLSDSAKRHVFINNIAATGTWNDYVDANMDFSGLSEAYVGAAKAAVSKLNGEMSSVWLAPNTYIDLASENPFWDSDNSKPKDLGEDGSTPTGSSPLIYLPLRGDDAGSNKGTGGDFTANSGPFTGARGPSEFWASSAEFNGTNQYLTRSSLIGASSAVTGMSFVASLYIDDVTADNEIFALTDGATVLLNLYSGASKMYGQADYDSSLDTNNNSISGLSGTWINVLFSADITGGVYKYFINGADETEDTPVTGSSQDFSGCDLARIGVGPNSIEYDGKIGFLWFNTEYIDFSDEANRLKFFDAFGYPVPLGEDGSTPTGNQPLIYLNKEFEAGTNYGSGGDFTPINSPTAGPDVKG